VYTTPILTRVKKVGAGQTSFLKVFRMPFSEFERPALHVGNFFRRPLVSLPFMKWRFVQ